jgi:hypothetical protein
VEKKQWQGQVFYTWQGYLSLKYGFFQELSKLNRQRAVYHLLPEVKQRLMEIAEDFREFLGVTDLQLKDITISG